MPAPFRHCETPCFFPTELITKMAEYGREMLVSLVRDDAYLTAAAQTVPEAYRVARPDAKPLFVQVDFGLTADGEPHLVEIQGFPSLYAYQPFLAQCYQQAYGLDSGLATLLGGLGTAGYAQALRNAIVGDHDPENVVLLEIDPYQQKTLPDFLMTERMCGLKIVSLMDVRQVGNRLFYPDGDRLVPIERIYNRVIVDELTRKNLTPPFDFRAELDVEWAGHPDWYFKISKFSLPYLLHSSVPPTEFLDRLAALPNDLDNYVLKPLFSFAGLGVRIGPTRAEIEAISDRSQYILQKRVDFAPLIETPHGPTKAEIRMMYLWQGEEPVALTSLVRMGRGKMLGVDQNRDAAWVGASAGFMR
ncbi:MAG: hypothetical protein JWL77_2647 [Chthonomonadaceae bacterium]|nr:hypothetical protein [Chthonomonadaceae bacterium]